MKILILYSSDADLKGTPYVFFLSHHKCNRYLNVLFDPEPQSAVAVTLADNQGTPGRCSQGHPGVTAEAPPELGRKQPINKPALFFIAKTHLI